MQALLNSSSAPAMNHGMNEATITTVATMTMMTMIAAVMTIGADMMIGIVVIAAR